VLLPTSARLAAGGDIDESLIAHADGRRRDLILSVFALVEGLHLLYVRELVPHPSTTTRNNNHNSTQQLQLTLPGT